MSRYLPAVVAVATSTGSTTVAGDTSLGAVTGHVYERGRMFSDANPFSCDENVELCYKTHGRAVRTCNKHRHRQQGHLRHQR